MTTQLKNNMSLFITDLAEYWDGNNNITQFHLLASILQIKDQICKSKSYENRFHWDDNTLDYLLKLYNDKGGLHMAIAAKIHCENCDLEDGETYEDLQADLIFQTLNKVQS